MVSLDVSSAKFLPKKLSLVFLVGAKKPSRLSSFNTVTVRPNSVWNAKTPLLRADLVVVGKVNMPAAELAKRVRTYSHEAGCVWLATDWPEFIRALEQNGFEKCSDNLYQKKSLTTPEEYGQGYIDRWGDTDFLANDKLAASQILAHLRPGMDKKEVSIIDVGCLNGYIMESLRRAGVQNIYGTDISYFLAIEKNLNPNLLTGITVADFSENDYPAHIFDVSVCMEVLEHIPPELTRTFIKQLARITKKQGILLISTSEDWDADDTHINCRNRAQWYFEFARYGLIAEGNQVIFPGFNSFVVRPTNGLLEAVRNRIWCTMKLVRAGRLKRPEDR